MPGGGAPGLKSLALKSVDGQPRLLAGQRHCAAVEHVFGAFRLPFFAQAVCVADRDVTGRRFVVEIRAELEECQTPPLHGAANVVAEVEERAQIADQCPQTSIVTAPNGWLNYHFHIGSPANPPAQVDVDPRAGHWLPSASRRPLYWKAILTARAARSAFLVNLWRLAMRRFVVVGAFFAAIAAFTIVGADAEPRTPAPVASLTAEVHRLLSESTFSYPDPWKPRRERPRQFFVIPGEKLDYAERLTAMGLAGLVNRAGPRLFVRGHFRFNADADRFWLSRLERDYGMPHKEIGLDQALKEFRGAFRGAVLCDDQLPATQAVALTLAGVLRLLPAMPSMQARLEAAGIPVTLDLRGAWKDNLAAQQWAFDLVGSRLNDQLIGFLDVRDKALWGIADYLVMHGGFIADLSSDRVKYPEEYALRDRAMARLKPGSIVWGWECHDNETLHVAHASRRGLRVLCSTNCPNLSFLALVKPETEQYRQRSPAPCHRPVEKELYLTFVLSDGDSILIREKCPISTGS